MNGHRLHSELPFDNIYIYYYHYYSPCGRKSVYALTAVVRAQTVVDLLFVIVFLRLPTSF